MTTPIPPSLTIIIPTYNEASTILQTIHAITSEMRKTSIPFEILVIDSSSPDDTRSKVYDAIALKYPVRLLTRDVNYGLSRAVVSGFCDAIGDVVVVTDADLSHDIRLIPSMYKRAKNGADIVIGTRYMVGGGIPDDWPLQRKIISSGATAIARLLFPDIHDPVSGFFAVRTDLVIDAPLEPRGYKILLEILGKTNWNRIDELPYHFVNRKAGTSKLKGNTIFQFILQIVDIATFPGKARDEVKRAVKFAVVGFSGILVNMLTLMALKEYAGYPLYQAGIIAIEVSIITNFLLNDFWTFKEKRNLGIELRFLMFNGIAAGGLIINMAVLLALVQFGMYYLVANLIGICVAFLWNFFLNRKITWRN